MITCRQCQDRLLRSERSPEVERHLGDCPPCAELAADGGALAGVLAAGRDVSGLEAAVLGAVTADRGVTGAARRAPTAVRVGGVVAFTVILAITVALAAGRPDLADYPATRMMAVLLGLFGTVAVASEATLRGMHRAPRRIGPLVGVALGVPLLIAGLPRAPGIDAPGFWPITAGCFAAGSVVALAMTALIAWLDRRTHVDPAALVLAVGAAGAAANAVLQVRCPVTEVAHLALGHGAVGLGWALVAWAVAVAVRR